MGKKKVMTRSEKLEKAVGEDFAIQFRSAQDDAVKNMIVTLTKEIDDKARLKKDDHKLTELAADLKAWGDSHYNDDIKGNRVKIKFLLDILESRGKL